MAASKKGLVLSALIVVVGVGWLLNVLTIVPGVNWAWTLALAAIGVLVLAAEFNKITAVIGPFLLAASVLSVARQAGHLRIDVEMPCLVIILGVLLFFVQVLPIPVPTWLLAEEPPAGE